MDPTSVNKNIKNRHFSINTLKVISAQRFWQIPVSDRTKHILTFSTPWGRYSFERLPFVISAAPEVFQSVMQQLFSKFANVKVAVYDILIHSSCLKKLLANHQYPNFMTSIKTSHFKLTPVHIQWEQYCSKTDSQ